MTAHLTFTAADDDLWDQYDDLATRSYGHPVADITHLRPHADLQVATRAGTVVAGGLGLLLPQYFGGAPVPSACLAAGCVAPEERGDQLATRMVTERLRVLQEQGAVISTISTSSNGYARRLGWEAPVPVFAWTLTTDDLTRSFTTTGTEEFDIDHGTTPQTRHLQSTLARQWNGPVARPTWWPDWKTTKSALTTYRFTRPNQPPTGLLSLTTTRRQRHGTTLQVHDFWAADAPTAHAILAFLGRHHTRAATIEFRRGALPPHPTLLHNLHTYRPSTDAWHPWMLRILDLPQAIRLRGWPPDLDATLPLGIHTDNTGTWTRRLLRIHHGTADISPTTRDPTVILTQRQLAVWYAGGYRTATAAHLAGIHATSEHALTTLIRSTTHLEPWLPDHF